MMVVCTATEVGRGQPAPKLMVTNRKNRTIMLRVMKTRKILLV